MSAEAFTREVFGQASFTLSVGHTYRHPEHGPIRITDGAYFRNGRLSNFWNWVVLETHETKCGYGGLWTEIKG